MKLVLITFGTAIVLLFIWFLFLAYQSKTAPKLGLVNGQLAVCIQSSNCVNSAEAGLEPITFTDAPARAWINMRQTLDVLGATVEQHTDNYLWATFSSPLFGYVDDVELLMETDEQRFQIRSASRVGRSDFNANRNRVAVIRDHFAQISSVNGS